MCNVSRNWCHWKLVVHLMAMLYAQNIYKNGWRVYKQKCRHILSLVIGLTIKVFRFYMTFTYLIWHHDMKKNWHFCNKTLCNFILFLYNIQTYKNFSTATTPQKHILRCYQTWHHQCQHVVWKPKHQFYYTASFTSNFSVF